MTFADATEQVLRKEGKPLSVDDIARRALEQGLIRPKSPTPVVYVRAAIRKDNRRRTGAGEKPRFILSPDGLVTLRF